MVQQLMSEGNIRIRLLKASPIGLIANTTWRFARTRSIKKLYIASGVASILRPCKKKKASYEFKTFVNEAILTFKQLFAVL